MAKKDPKNHAEGTGKLLYPVRVWLDEETYALLKKHAKAQDRTLAAQVRYLLRKCLTELE